MRWLLLLRSTGSRCEGLASPRHVGSSRTRARTRVPCIGRRILNHCATREVLEEFLIPLLVQGKEASMSVQHKHIWSLGYIKCGDYISFLDTIPNPRLGALTGISTRQGRVWSSLHDLHIQPLDIQQTSTEPPLDTSQAHPMLLRCKDDLGKVPTVSTLQ